MAELTGAPPLAPDRIDQPFADPLLERLFPPLPTGVHWGLERTERALEALGDPHRAYPTLHIGGTNGKGSVTATLASVLCQGGLEAGCYTSPHLVSFRERMLVGGEPLEESALLGYAEDAREAVLRFGLTFFEAVTVLAFHAFARRGVEVAAIEVGLGGRLDATNVLIPEVTAVTNLAMDHADYLGDTLPEIAREKAGIMKRGVPFVTAESDPELVGLFGELARRAGAPMTHVPPGAARDISVRRDSTSFLMSTSAWGELELTTPLVGLHQARNAALAVAVLEQLSEPLRPTKEAVLRGVRRVEYHGRDEVRIIGGRTWVFNAAHNTAGVESLSDTLDRLDLPRPVIALIGVLGDKDWGSMLPPLLSRTDGAYLTQPSSAPRERRWDPDAAAAEVERVTTVHVVEDFAQALRDAAERAGTGTVVATGSVHTVGSAMRELGLDPLG